MLFSLARAERRERDETELRIKLLEIGRIRFKMMDLISV